MSCSVGCLRFIDSFQCLSASLDDYTYDSEVKYEHFHNMKTNFQMCNYNYFAKKVIILMNGLMTIKNKTMLDYLKGNTFILPEVGK